jgi:hypothetical protein
MQRVIQHKKLCEIKSYSWKTTSDMRQREACLNVWYEETSGVRQRAVEENQSHVRLHEAARHAGVWCTPWKLMLNARDFERSFRSSRSRSSYLVVVVRLQLPRLQLLHQLPHSQVLNQLPRGLESAGTADARPAPNAAGSFAARGAM